MSSPFAPGDARPPAFGPGVPSAQAWVACPSPRTPDTLGVAHARTRRLLGLVLWLAGMLLGVVLNLVIYGPVFHHAAAVFEVFKVALVAYIPVALYLFVPVVVDRYDPEPWWALAMAFGWGAVFATGVSSIVNSGFLELLGPNAAAVLSAPLFEEATKGAVVLGMFLFLRREFDGVVDGVVYGAFAGIGFAATENIQYYLTGSLRGHLDDMFVLRGILTPWVHPLFTAMTGVGVGLARERGEGVTVVLFPVLGYSGAVLLHAVWNGANTLLGAETMGDYLPVVAVGVALALGFVAIVVSLALRKGRILRRHLADEVVVGTISDAELELICAPFARIRAARWPGGRAFARAGARLAFTKWHALRAERAGRETVSLDFIGPLRAELALLRATMRGRSP